MKLLESAGSNRLYHGTSIIGFCSIAQTNMLGAYGGEEQASFTLDVEVAKNFCQSAVDLCRRAQLTQYSDFDPSTFTDEDGEKLTSYKAEMIAGGQGAVLVFDRAALHRDYEFFAVNFESEGLETVDFGAGDDEQEECVFGDVKNLDRYLVGIMIDRPGFERYCALIRELLPNDHSSEAMLSAAERWVQRFP